MVRGTAAALPSVHPPPFHGPRAARVGTPVSVFRTAVPVLAPLHVRARRLWHSRTPRPPADPAARRSAGHPGSHVVRRLAARHPSFGLHGNTDPILIFFLLLSIYLIDSQRPPWLAGAALGMAANFKL